MTRYSWMALRGNGFPLLWSSPATPPLVRSFLRLVPSTKTLTVLAVCPPAEKLRDTLLMRSSEMVTPGARAARSRKFRLAVGSRSICCCVTFVAISDVRISTPAAATTDTPSTWIAEAASFKSKGNTSPINTRTRSFWGAMPICRAVTSYSVGTRPSSA